MRHTLIVTLFALTLATAGCATPLAMKASGTAGASPLEAAMAAPAPDGFAKKAHP